MKIAYSKLGRSVLLDPKKWGEVGGDNEPLHLLLTLAQRHPDVEWVVAGRNSGPVDGLPPNVVVPDLPKKDENAWRAACADLYVQADGAVIWLGQHGTSNMPIPQDKDPTVVTNPQEWSQRYAGPIIQGLNRADNEYEPVWLCADPRNYLKARDLKWYPTQPILGQFKFVRAQRHYRFEDHRTPEEAGAPSSVPSWHGSERLAASGVPPSNFWLTEHSYVYSGLELTGVPRWEDRDWPTWDERDHFGIVINEARAYVNPARARANIVRDWVNPLKPTFFHGKWSPEGLKTIGLDEVAGIHYTQLPEVLSRAKSTFTTPTSGSGWATAKFWEAAALGVVCFLHPEHDTQGHLVPTYSPAYDWLRPRTPQDLWARVRAVHEDEATYDWLVQQQRELLNAARREQKCVTEIERRLGLTS